MQVKRTGIYSGKAFAALMGVVLVGVLIGSLLYSHMDADAFNIVGSLQADFISDRSGNGFSTVLLKCLGSSSLFLLVEFLSGFSAVGHPAAVGALCVRGLGSGVLLARLYSGYSVRGIAYVALTILPDALLSAAALSLAAREALCLSNTYALFTLSERQVEGIKRPIKLYCTKFLVLEAVLALSAGLECLIAWISKGFVLK